jgi:hypothetical protein
MVTMAEYKLTLDEAQMHNLRDRLAHAEVFGEAVAKAVEEAREILDEMLLHARASTA